MGRALSRLGGEGQLGLARIDVGVQLQVARAQGLGEVTEVAMDAVARASMRADQLAQMVPSAAGRLQALGDAMTMAEIGVVHDTARRLR